MGKRAEALGIGLTVLLRRYIETMALQDEMSTGKQVRITLDELNFLTEAVTECGRQDEYADLLSRIFEVVLMWRFGGLDIPPEAALREVMSMLRMQNRILEYDVRVVDNLVVTSFTAPSKAVGTAIGMALVRLLNSVGAKTELRSVGTTFLVEVRRA